MTINEYQKLALRTEAPKDFYRAPEAVLKAFAMLGAISNPQKDLSVIRLMEGLMGLNGEAGEALDILKKILFQGHGIDRNHIALELGDIAWYLALSADAIGYDLETIMSMNIEKLKARYPNGFETERSVNREEGDI